jgi:hypothetical protein
LFVAAQTKTQPEKAVNAAWRRIAYNSKRLPTIAQVCEITGLPAKFVMDVCESAGNYFGVTEMADLTREHFSSYPSGNIICGIRHWIRTDLGLEDHECYQFHSLKELTDEAAAFQDIAGMEKVEIVTHDGEYKNMRVLYRWEKAA